MGFCGGIACPMFAVLNNQKILIMTTLLIKTTARYSIHTEKYTPVKEYNVNERINFRAIVRIGHILDYYPSPFRPVLTKEERDERYLLHCYENGLSLDYCQKHNI
jgi:hypothetical protein